MVKTHNCRHPDLFESCNLLVVADIEGIKRNKTLKIYIGPKKIVIQ